MPSSKSHRAVLRKRARADARRGFRAIAEVRMGSHERRRELVNHPSHYGGDTLHEVIKCLEAWGLESDALLWNAVKYIARFGKKPCGGVTDLKKAAFYLDRRIVQMLQSANASKSQPTNNPPAERQQKRNQR